MKKSISSSKLADELAVFKQNYRGAFGLPTVTVWKAFELGWAARGKADKEVIESLKAHCDDGTDDLWWNAILEGMSEQINDIKA